MGDNFWSKPMTFRRGSGAYSPRRAEGRRGGGFRGNSTRGRENRGSFSFNSLSAHRPQEEEQPQQQQPMQQLSQPMQQSYNGYAGNQYPNGMPFYQEFSPPPDHYYQQQMPPPMQQQQPNYQYARPPPPQPSRYENVWDRPEEQQPPLEDFEQGSIFRGNTSTGEEYRMEDYDRREEGEGRRRGGDMRMGYREGYSMEYDGGRRGGQEGGSVWDREPHDDESRGNYEEYDGRTEHNGRPLDDRSYSFPPNGDRSMNEHRAEYGYSRGGEYDARPQEGGYSNNSSRGEYSNTEPAYGRQQSVESNSPAVGNYDRGTGRTESSSVASRSRRELIEYYKRQIELLERQEEEERYREQQSPTMDNEFRQRVEEEGTSFYEQGLTSLGEQAMQAQRRMNERQRSNDGSFIASSRDLFFEAQQYDYGETNRRMRNAPIPTPRRTAPSPTSRFNGQPQREQRSPYATRDYDRPSCSNNCSDSSKYNSTECTTGSESSRRNRKKKKPKNKRSANGSTSNVDDHSDSRQGRSREDSRCKSKSPKPAPRLSPRREMFNESETSSGHPRCASPNNSPDRPEEAVHEDERRNIDDERARMPAPSLNPPRDFFHQSETSSDHPRYESPNNSPEDRPEEARQEDERSNDDDRASCSMPSLMSTPRTLCESQNEQNDEEEGRGKEENEKVVHSAEQGCVEEPMETLTEDRGSCSSYGAEEVQSRSEEGRGVGYNGQGSRAMGAAGSSGARSDDGSEVSKLPNSVQNMELNRGPLPQQRRYLNASEAYKTAPKPLKAIREGKKMVQLTTNVYEFEHTNTLVYRYDISVSLHSVEADADGHSRARTINLNKGPRDDASQRERHELVRLALRRGLEMYRTLSESGVVAHDGAALMFANEDLEGALKPHQHHLTIPVEQLDVEARGYIRNHNVRSVEIEVQACREGLLGHTFRMGDVSRMLSDDRSGMDFSVKQFYEVVTSADAVDSGQFTFLSGGKLYRNDPEGGDYNRHARRVGRGFERIEGMTKGFAVAEGTGGMSSAVAALIIDRSVGTFWSSGPLLNTICEINNWNSPEQVRWTPEAISRTNELLKNVRLSYAEPGKPRYDFIFGGLTEVTLDRLKEKDKDGNEIMSSSKFANVQLKFMKWPCIECKIAKRTGDKKSTNFETISKYFPVEVLKVMSHQRVSLQKQQAAFVQPETAIKPKDRYSSVGYMVNALNLMGDSRIPGRRLNRFAEGFGIRLKSAPMKTEGIIRQMPQMMYKGRMADVTNKANWRTGMLQFAKGGNLNMLAIGYTGIDRREVDKAAKIIEETARKKGLRIDAGGVRIEEVAPDRIAAVLKRLSDERKKKPGFSVLFLYIEPEESKSHRYLKLMERRYLVPTQHLTTERCKEIAGSNRPVIENVISKTNVKCGGHNYTVNPEKFASHLWMGDGRKTMIVGYDVWHPPPLSRYQMMQGKDQPEPSVVGFSFNGGPMPDAFCGDYHYQERRKERVNQQVLNVRIKWMLREFERVRRSLPELIIICRDGVSDGQFTHAMDELEELREGAAEWARCKERSAMLKEKPIDDYKPKFIFIVATKRHHRRLWAEGEFRGRKEMTNPPAMTAVDTTIVTPMLFEFFLQSHTPLQGQAKATRYIVLKDDVGTTQDAIQALMGALCFEHQISANSISIPEPIYQADEWAKRGAENYKQFRESFPPSDDTFEDLTRKLGYWNTSLQCLRTNA